MTAGEKRAPGGAVMPITTVSRYGDIGRCERKTLSFFFFTSLVLEQRAGGALEPFDWGSLVSARKDDPKQYLVSACVRAYVHACLWLLPVLRSSRLEAP